jgi:single-stranded-DNA-specific exonuclease
MGVDVGAAVRAARDVGLLEAGGGHAMAAGFSLTDAQVEPFRAFLARWFAERAGVDAVTDLDLGLTVAASGATEELVDEIARMGPFGSGNAEPLCAVLDVSVSFADVVGQNHVRLRLAGADGARLDGIAFRAADTDLGRALLKARGQRIHAAGYLRCDVWNGRKRVQLQLEDAAPVMPG